MLTKNKTILSHFEVDSLKLKNALQEVKPAIASRAILPILSSIAFFASKESQTVSLESTDLEQGIVFTIPAKVKNSGSFCIDGKFLLAIVKRAEGVIEFIEHKDNTIITEIKSPEDAEIRAPKNIVEILNGSSKTSSSVLPTDDWPELKPKKLLEIDLKISGKELSNALKKCLPAASTDSTKNILNAVNVRLLPELHFSATDGYRLFVYGVNNLNYQLEKDPISDKEYNLHNSIIPSDSVKTIIKLFQDSEVVNISRLENVLMFSSENIFFSSRIIDGQYPSFERIVPKDFENIMVLRREDLLNALASLTDLNSSLGVRVPLIKLNFYSEKSELSVSSEWDVLTGTESTVVIPAVLETGKYSLDIWFSRSGGETSKPKDNSNDNEDDSNKKVETITTFSINFNSAFLHEMLSQINETYLQVYFKGPLSPCVINYTENSMYPSKMLLMQMPIRS